MGFHHKTSGSRTVQLPIWAMGTQRRAALDQPSLTEPQQAAPRRMLFRMSRAQDLVVLVHLSIQQGLSWMKAGPLRMQDICSQALIQ